MNKQELMTWIQSELTLIGGSSEELHFRQILNLFHRDGVFDTSTSAFESIRKTISDGEMSFGEVINIANLLIHGYPYARLYFSGMSIPADLIDDYLHPENEIITEIIEDIRAAFSNLLTLREAQDVESKDPEYFQTFDYEHIKSISAPPLISGSDLANIEDMEPVSRFAGRGYASDLINHGIIVVDSDPIKDGRQPAWHWQKELFKQVPKRASV